MKGNTNQREKSILVHGNMDRRQYDSNRPLWSWFTPIIPEIWESPRRKKVASWRSEDGFVSHRRVHARNESESCVLYLGIENAVIMTRSTRQWNGIQTLIIMKLF
jgi:hypothetical protein